MLLPEKDYLGKEDRLSGKCARDKFVLQLQDICLEKVDFCLAIARQICLVRIYQINCLLFQDSTFMGVLLNKCQAFSRRDKFSLFSNLLNHSP